MKTLTVVLLLCIALLLIACGSPQNKWIEGTWSVSMTPTVGGTTAMAFNTTVLTNPDNSSYVANLFITTSNGCMDTNSKKTVAYDTASKQISFYVDNVSNGGVYLHGTMMDGETGTGTYDIMGTSQSCQGGGMFTMTRIPNPGPNRGGR